MPVIQTLPSWTFTSAAVSSPASPYQLRRSVPAAVRSVEIAATKTSLPPEWAVVVVPAARPLSRLVPVRMTFPLAMAMPAISPEMAPRSRVEARVGTPAASRVKRRTTAWPSSTPAV